MAENNKKNTHMWEPQQVLLLLKKIWAVLFAMFKVAAGAAATVLLIGIVCGFVFVGMLADYLQEDIMPSAHMELGGYDMDLTSTVYHVNEDGQIEVLQELYATTDRKLATYDEIPEALIHAAVAIEDKRFFEHQGVDWFTTIKAVAGMFFSNDTVGGSSITQQLIKNQTGEDSVTVQRKVLEFFRATYVEKRYNKNIIITEYLNWIYLGQNCSGVKSAAEAYFGKELQMLTVAECASLISITNNPSLFDPYSKNEFMYAGKLMNGQQRNRYRQELVLKEMLNQGWITQEVYDEAYAQELVFKSGIADEDRWETCDNQECDYENIVSTFVKDGEVYYCPKCSSRVEVAGDASQAVYSWFVDTVLEDVAKALAAKDEVEWNEDTEEYYKILIGKRGYHIYTTLDMKVQNAVDRIYTNLKEIPATWSAQQLESGIVVIDNRTGDIVAMAGGVGEKTVFDAHSIATDAKLQSGSSFKPIAIYAPAFESGTITPATVVKDLPFLYDEEGDSWPKNDNKLYSYRRTIYSAIEDSVNAAATNTLSLIGVSYGYKYAKEMFGMSTLTDSYVNSDGTISTDRDYAPLALGAQTTGITVRDMTNAYATFANNGTFRYGRTFTKVYDTEGNLVLDNEQETRDIISEKTVNYMNYCLTNAVNNGTGTRAKISGTVVAGKTGSTSSFRDRWFCGYTQYYTAAVWCGYRSPEVINPVGGNYNVAAELWRKVMEPLHTGKPWAELYDSSDMVDVTVCLDSGKLATEACLNDVRGISRTQTVKVYEEDIPVESCTKHVMVDYCVSGNGVANEYCKLLSNAGASVTLKSSALLKITQDEMQEILAATKVGLSSSNYVRNDYVYLVDSSGAAVTFKGFYNNANHSVLEPYIVCTQHTRHQWDSYAAAHPNAAG